MSQSRLWYRFILHFLCFAATQLARQVQQERTQVVCSNKVARKRLDRSDFFRHLDFGQFKWQLGFGQRQRRKGQSGNGNTETSAQAAAATSAQAAPQREGAQGDVTVRRSVDSQYVA